MEWMLLPYRRYAEFSGRSRRREFWLFQLFLILVSVVIYALFGRAMTLQTASSYSYTNGLSSTGQLIQDIFALVSFIPNLAVSVRRLHDIDRSGWWLLLLFIPVIGWIILLVFDCLDGTAGTNRYGFDPKGRAVGDVFS